MRFFVLLVIALALSCAAQNTGEVAMKKNVPDTAKASFEPQALPENGFVLDNGLKVVLTEQHSYPMICSVVVVNVGSANESSKLNGISHMVEHYAFNGTKTRTEEQIYAEIDKISGYNNASTGKNYTSYIMLAPKENIGAALDVQTDMLFNSAIPESKLEREKGVVIEEIKKDLASPGNKKEEFFDEKFFAGTSFSRPVIGTPEVINSITVKELSDYYHEYYVPNNMTLWVTGDFDKKEMTKKIKKYFGAYPLGAQPKENKKNKLDYPENKMFTAEVEDGSESVDIGFFGPGPFEEDYYAFSTAVPLLNKHLADTFSGANAEGISGINCGYSVYRGVSIVRISASLSAATDAKSAVNRVMRAVNAFGSGEITPAQLQQAKLKVKAEEVYAKEKIHYYVFGKVPYIAVGAWDAMQNYVKKTDMLTTADVNAVTKKYFYKPKYTATAVTLPVKKTTFIKTDPDLKTDSAVFHKTTFENGLTIIYKKVHASDIFSMHVLVKNRSVNEPVGKDGIADFLNRAVAKTGVADSTEAKLEAIGAEAQFVDNPYIPFDDYYTTNGFSFIRLQALNDYFEDAISITARAMKSPDFSEQQLNTVRDEMKQAFMMGAGSPVKKAGRLFISTLLPGSHLNKPVLGTPEIVDSITAEDLKNFHQNYFSPDNIVISIVSSMDKQEVFDRIVREFGYERRYEGARPAAYVMPESPVEDKTVKETLGKPQSCVKIGTLLAEVKDPSEQLSLTMLGNVLSSRLTDKVRVKKGLTYSMGAGISFEQDRGILAVTVGTGKQNIDEVAKIITEELGGLKDFTVTKEELEREVNSVAGRLFMRNISSLNQAYYLGINEFEGKGYMWGEEVIGKMKKLTPEKLQAVAKKYLAGNKYLTVVVE
ncbi:MAG: insulinase family protein [Planctomycetes bacterium]|nr:insulinase family protein [Planctomycetota bacterium]